MNWYKSAQQKEDNWIIAKMVATFGIGTIMAILALKGMTMPDLAKEYQLNPQQFTQEAKQIEEQEQNQEIVETSTSQVSDELKETIARHEGYENTVYTDTEGVPTIGIGFNLRRSDAPGKLSNLGVDIQDVLNGKALTDEQINSLFQDDVRMATDDAQVFLSNFGQQPEAVKNVLVNMSFNLGLTKLLKFEDFQKALLSGDYQQAAKEMVDSEWYHQVGNRSKELVNIIRRIR